MIVRVLSGCMHLQAESSTIRNNRLFTFFVRWNSLTSQSLFCGKRSNSQSCSGGTVQIVHCVPGLDSKLSRHSPQLHHSLKDFAREEIAKLQRQAGTAFPVLITDQSISTDIGQAAQEFQADLVVTGRGRIQESFGTLRTHELEITSLVSCPVISFCSREEECPSVETIAQVATSK